MLIDDIEKTFVGTIRPIENLTLTVEDEFLQVECNGLCNTEILGVLRNIDLEFLSGPEKMINGMAAGENDRAIKGDLNLLLSEIL